MCGLKCALPDPCAGVEICQNGGQCVENCADKSDYYCNCSLGWTGKNCTEPVSNFLVNRTQLPYLFNSHKSPNGIRPLSRKDKCGMHFLLLIFSVHSKFTPTLLSLSTIMVNSGWKRAQK